MRKEQIMPLHRVRVNPNLDRDHVAYEYRGREGVIQPAQRPRYPDVAVKLDGDVGSTYYFRPEWLISLEEPPRVGDIVEVQGQVVTAKGDIVQVRFRDSGEPVMFLADRLVIVKRGPVIPPEPAFGSIVRGHNKTSDLPVGAWWRRLGRRHEAEGGKNWLSLVSSQPHQTWAEVVEYIRKAGADIQVYGPTEIINLDEPLDPGEEVK